MKFLKAADYKEENDFLQDLSKNSKTVGWVYEKRLEKNRLNDAGIMKRYSLECIGKQPTLKSMRAEKADQFKLLKNDRTGREYEMWFLNYSPIKLDDKIVNSKEELLEKQETMPKKTVKPKTKKKTQKQKSGKDILKMLFKN